MDGACYGRCPAPAAGQAARRTHESLGILRACSGEAGVIGGQQYHDYFGDFSEHGKEYPGLYFGSDAQQMTSNLNNDGTRQLIR